MSNTTHTGSCHCGAVRFHVDIDLEQPVIACNCSMCQRAGTLLSFVPESAFTLEQGEDSLTDYQFNHHVIHHVFCKTCGIKPFARGSGPNGPTVAVNVRCLHDVEIGDLKVHPFDGRSK